MNMRQGSSKSQETHKERNNERNAILKIPHFIPRPTAIPRVSFCKAKKPLSPATAKLEQKSACGLLLTRQLLRSPAPAPRPAIASARGFFTRGSWDDGQAAEGASPPLPCTPRPLSPGAQEVGKATPAPLARG